MYWTDPTYQLNLKFLYLIALQFEEALSTTTTEGERVLTLNKPLNDADCEFLRTIFVPATKNHSTLSFPKFFDDEKLQGYAIVLKIISGKIWNLTHSQEKQDKRDSPGLLVIQMKTRFFITVAFVNCSAWVVDDSMK